MSHQVPDNGFQVVPSDDEDEMLVHSSFHETSEEDPTLPVRRRRSAKASSRSTRHAPADQQQLDELEDEELPPFEWHPLALLLGGAIKQVSLPFLRIVFAPKAQRTMIKSAIIMVVLGWIFLTSITAYLTFYQQYVPRTAHHEPIFFQYGHVQSRQSVEPNSFVDLAHGGAKPPLRHEQAYDVFVQLHVPTSDINFNLGNFMIHTELLTQDDTVLAQSSRPAILRYQSQSQRILHVMAKAIPLLVGLMEESQVVSVPLIEGYMEHKSNPVMKAFVSISDPNVQIYDAQLSIQADFRGLRYYMYHRRIPTAITFILLFMAIELLFTYMAWRSFGQKFWYNIQDLFEEVALEQQASEQLAERQGLTSAPEPAPEKPTTSD
ncbi:DUF1226-domain-containing protein [Hesseltinella vesiculosa]|uniref:DUF1226-domain-containing protein n=1 Tax=Hesseltinella vesiculosa TaxID=101127 RepID=A0A1X2GX69_9FUNG|nr:DUF1226-domain-containing protein [Hesseltinella vesiculosa]